MYPVNDSTVRIQSYQTKGIQCVQLEQKEKLETNKIDILCINCGHVHIIFFHDFVLPYPNEFDVCLFRT